MLIVAQPEALERACGGWMRGLEKPRQTTFRNPFTGETTTKQTYLPERMERPTTSFATVMEAIERLQPVSEEITLPRGARWVLDEARVLFVGFDLDDIEDGSEEDLAEAMQVPLPVYELRDEDASELLAEEPSWAKYADAALREAAGLKVYFFLFSY